MSDAKIQTPLKKAFLSENHKTSVFLFFPHNRSVCTKNVDKVDNFVDYFFFGLFGTSKWWKTLNESGKKKRPKSKTGLLYAKCTRKEKSRAFFKKIICRQFPFFLKGQA